MPWGAVASAAVGLYTSHKASKKADKQYGREDEFRERELDQADRQFDWTKSLYDENKSRYDPVFENMMSQIDDVEPDYGAIAGDINSSFDAQQGAEERNMRRYGIRPDDGQARAAGRDWGIRKAATHVGARSAARQGAKDKRFSRYADVYNVGQGIGTQNAAMVTGAMSNQQSSLRSAANASSRRGDQLYQRGQDDAAGWGQAIGGIDWSGIWGQIKGWGNSDIRLKENVRLIGQDRGMNIYSWEWNDLAHERGVTDPTIGVIAQEHIESGFVKLVDGFYKVDYSGLFGSRRLQ